ncbi:brachyurin-like [Epargyreus clarus]|uniref:brachyurin-like n=1 Tax=Epargyreus clarus TaxID=520877 RepID=UPI003C2C254D
MARLFIFILVSLFTWCHSEVDIDNIGWHQKVGIKEAQRIKHSEDLIRIVGGFVSPANAHPYLAGIVIDVFGVNSPSACGGSLLSQTRVLTAAHCWNDGRIQAWRFTIVLGSSFLFHGGLRIATSAIELHPAYNSRTLANDIAMVRLPVRVPFSNAIRPIKLPSGFLLTFDFTGVWARASGYGRYSDLFAPSMNTMVRHIVLQVISQQRCRQVYGGMVLDSNICTNGTGGVGICQGDSGGPLMVRSQGEDIIIGVSSFVALDGCELGFPSAFARISSFIGWIRSHM